MDALDHIAEAGHSLLARADLVLAAGGAPVDHPVWPLLREAGALPGDVFAAMAGLRPEVFEATAARIAPYARAYRAEQGLLAAPPDCRGPTADLIRTRCAALAGHLAGRSGGRATGDPSRAAWSSDAGPPGASATADGLAGRMAATAGYLGELVDWLVEHRARMAAATARCVGSSDAVVLRAVPLPHPGQTHAGQARYPGPAHAGQACHPGQVYPWEARFGHATGWPADERPLAGPPPAQVCGAAARVAVEILAAGTAACRAGETLRGRWSDRLAELPWSEPPDAPHTPGAVLRLPL